MPPAVKAIHLRRATTIVGGGTMLSRVLGLVREMVLAAVFGAGGAMDAFFVAFRIPNTLRRLLAEGGVTVAVQPVYTERLQAQEGGSEAAAARLRDFERSMFSLARVVLLVVSFAGVVAAPLIVPVFAAGFALDGPQYEAAVWLLRLLFPFVYFIGLIGIAMGMLNARGFFLAPAIGPAVLNVGMIVGAAALTHWVRPEWPATAGVAAGALAGVVGWWWLLRGSLARVGASLRWLWQPRNREIRATLLLLLPAVAGLAVYQLQVVVGTQFASFLSVGGVSCLSYADRLVQFPLALVGTAIGTVALPLFSRARANDEPLGPALGDALGWTLFLALPATAGLILIREPLVRVLFERGAFDATATARTAAAVLGYGLALVPATINRVLLPAFYADKDMRTPVWTGAAALVVQAAASWWWFRYDVFGLAAATALASAVQSGLLWWRLRRRGHGPTGLGTSLLRTLVATGTMAAVVAWLLEQPIDGYHPILVLLAALVAGAGSYAVVALALRHPEAERARRFLGAPNERGSQ